MSIYTLNRTSILPAEYQEVEYIQGSGTQYINTLIKLSSSDTIKAKFELNSAPTSYSEGVFGTMEPISSHNTFFTLLMRTPNLARVGTSSNQVTSTNVDTNTIYTIELSNGTYIENGTTYTFTPSNTFTFTKNCYVFLRNQDSMTPVNGKFYSFEIVGKFKGIPCYRKANNEIGMYDLVSETFFTNAGTGTFIKGNDVGGSGYESEENEIVLLKKTNNLFDEISAYTKTGFTISNGEISTNYNYARHSFSQYGSNEFSLSESTTYYVSYKIKIACSNPSGNKSIWISFKNVGTGQNYAVTGFSVDNFDEWKSISFNQTLPAGSYQVALGAYGGSVGETYTTTLKDIMFDTKQITAYEPYGYETKKYKIKTLSVLDRTFGNNTPAGIARASANIAANSMTAAQVATTYGWNIGDTINITLKNSEQIQMRIIGINHDTLSSDHTSKAGLTLQMVNCLATLYRMNDSNTNAGGWQSSKMKVTTMPTLLALLPDEWQAVIKTVDKKSANGGSLNYSATVTTSENLFLLAGVEIFGSSDSYGYAQDGANEGTQYAYWASHNTANDRIKNYDNAGTPTATYWWERSSSSGDTNYFCAVDIGGSAKVYSASVSRGVAFGFCV